MAFQREEGADQTGEQERGIYFVKKEMLLNCKGSSVKYTL